MRHHHLRPNLRLLVLHEEHQGQACQREHAHQQEHVVVGDQVVLFPHGHLERAIGHVRGLAQRMAGAHEVLGEAGEAVLRGGIVDVHVGEQGVVVYGIAIGEEDVEPCDARCSADLADHVGDTCGLADVGALHALQADGEDGAHHHAHAHAAQDERPEEAAFAAAGRAAAHEEGESEDDDDPRTHDEARVHAFAEPAAYETHGYAGGDGAGDHEHASHQRGPAQTDLHEEREDEHGAHEHQAQDRVEDGADGHVAFHDQTYVHRGMRRVPFPPDEHHEAHGGNDAEHYDQRAAEPIVLRTFFQHVLQGAYADH